MPRALVAGEPDAIEIALRLAMAPPEQHVRTVGEAQRSKVVGERGAASQSPVLLPAGLVVVCWHDQRGWADEAPPTIGGAYASHPRLVLAVLEEEA